MKNFYFIMFAVFTATVSSIFFHSAANSQRIASAEEYGYLRVITEDTPFYAEKTDETPAFFLPYTYYVRVLERGEIFTHIEYGAGGAAIDGYAPTEKLFADGLSVNNPYPEPEVYTSSTAVLYKSAALTDSVQFIFEARKLYLYGAYISDTDEKIYYVGYNNKLGYVKEEALVPFTIENHPNELTFLAPDKKDDEPNSAKESEPTKTAVDLKIAIIVVLGAAGIIALFAAFSKKAKPSPAASYYDENDYE